MILNHGVRPALKHLFPLISLSGAGIFKFAKVVIIICQHIPFLWYNILHQISKLRSDVGLKLSRQ
jgi:hypothetical protein